MSTLLQYPHVTLDADGSARIDATRYKVIHCTLHDWASSSPPGKESALAARPTISSSC